MRVAHIKVWVGLNGKRGVRVVAGSGEGVDASSREARAAFEEGGRTMNDLAERIRLGERESPTSSPARIHMHVPVASDGQTLGVAKTVLLRTPGGYVVAVIPVESTIDIENVQGLLGECPVCEANDEERSVLFPELVGTEVPSFGSQHGVRTLVDIHLASNPIVELTDNQGKPFAMLFEDFDLFENPIRGLISR